MKIALFLLLALVASANDCVPLTFSTLSKVLSEEVKYEEWCDLVGFTQTREPTQLGVALDAWETRMKHWSFFCIYHAQMKKSPDGIMYDHPHFWVGKPSDEMVDGAPEAHAAILIMRSVDGQITFDLYHTLEPSKLVHEKLTPKQFFERTYAVFEPIFVYRTAR